MKLHEALVKLSAEILFDQHEQMVNSDANTANFDSHMVNLGCDAAAVVVVVSAAAVVAAVAVGGLLEPPLAVAEAYDKEITAVLADTENLAANRVNWVHDCYWLQHCQYC